MPEFLIYYDAIASQETGTTLIALCIDGQLHRVSAVSVGVPTYSVIDCEGGPRLMIAGNANAIRVDGGKAVIE